MQRLNAKLTPLITVDITPQNVNDAPVAMGRFGGAANDAVFAVRRAA